MSAGNWWQAEMFKPIICFKHKPFVTHDSSVARRCLASSAYTMIQIVTTSMAQREKNNQRFVQQNFHQVHTFGMKNNTILAYLRLAFWGLILYFFLFIK